MMSLVFKRIIAFALLLLTHSPAQAIRNGQPVPVGQYSAVGYLEPRCTGTLVTPNTVLTAAHCVAQAGPIGNLQFTYTTKSGVKRSRQAMQIRVLSEYYPQELALIRLDANAEDVDIPELYVFQTNPRGAIAQIAGYGWTATANQNDLLGGEVKIEGLSQIDIGEGPLPMLTVTATQISNMPCPGDSGGPIFIDGKLAGVISFSDADPFLPPFTICAKTTRAYYVPAPLYIHWIQENL